MGTSPWEDLKFAIYRADFLDSGSVEFYNPELSDANKTVATLQPNSLNVVSRQLRVGLGTTVGDSNYALGNTFSQLGTNATGDLLGTAGIATGSMTIINAGLGYTPASGNFTFNGVDMVTVTGNGRGAKADITIKMVSLLVLLLELVVLVIKLAMFYSKHNRCKLCRTKSQVVCRWYWCNARTYFG